MPQPSCRTARIEQIPSGHDTRSAGQLLLICSTLALLTACGGSSGLALQSTTELRSEFAPGACRDVELRPDHLVVDWSPEDRSALEIALRRGPVAISYFGCRLEVIGACVVPGQFRFEAVTPKHQSLELVGKDALNAYVVTGTSKIGAGLAEGGRIMVSLTMVGRFEAVDVKTRVEELEGNCAEVTHIVTRVDIGAFSAERESDDAYELGSEGLGSGHTVRATRRLDGDGREQDCWSGEQPPRGCSAPLRISLTEVLVPLPDFAGRWVGHFTQPLGLYPQYSMVLDIEQDGRDLRGSSTVEVAETGEWAQIGLIGRIEGQQALFEEYEVLDGSDDFCLKEGRMAVSVDQASLSGVWSSDLLCPGGELFLRREVQRTPDGPSVPALDGEHERIDKVFEIPGERI